MNSRSRVLILGLGALLLQLLLLFSMFYYVINPKIIEMEKKLVVKNLHRGLELLQRELFHLEHLTQILAQLPMMQQAVSVPTQETVSGASLQEKMQRLEVNLLIILNNSHEVMWENIIDLNAEQPYPKQPILTNLWEKRPKFFDHSNLLSLQGGIYNSTLGPMFVVSAPITSPAGQKVQGTLITGKLITQDVIHLLQSISYTDLKLWPLGGSSLSAKQENIIRRLQQADSDFTIEQAGALLQGFMYLLDINEQPNLLMSTTQSRGFSEAMEISFAEVAAMVIGLQCVFLCLLSFLIYRSVYVPTQQLIEKVDSTKEEWQPAENNHRKLDEVGLLENAITNFVLRQREQLRKDTAQAYREGVTQTRENLFQELEETLFPIIEGIEQAEKKLSNLPVNDIEWVIAESKTGQISSTNFDDYTQRLQAINDKLRFYQKDARRLLYELFTKALRNAAALRAQSRSLDSMRQFTPISTERKKRRPMARS